MEKDYVCKSVKGRESPKCIPKFCIAIKPHIKWNGSDFLSDVVFKNYIEELGNKKYVSYSITDDKIYFRFYENSGDSIRRFKMFSYYASGTTVSNNSLAINTCNKPEITKWYTDLCYPVYYLKSSDEYFIRLEDGKRTPLFNSYKKKGQDNMATRNTMRGFQIDREKVKKLLKRTGLTYSDLSREMGFGASAVSSAIKNGRFSYGMATQLAKLYNIHSEDYEYVAPEPVVEEPKEESTALRFELNLTEELENRLYKMIYSAVYEAVKKAWSE